MEEVSVREATRNDLHAIAVIHKSQFSDHFLGQYSVPLIERFYQSFLVKCVFLVSSTSGIINGFVLGGHREDLDEAKSRFLKNSKVALLMETIKNPGIYFHALERLVSMIARKNDLSNISVANFRLLSIAVAEAAKGSGIAKKIIQEFEREIAPVNEYGLSVKMKNKRAINYYYKNGFILEKEIGESQYFIKTIERSQAVGP